MYDIVVCYRANQCLRDKYSKVQKNDATPREDDIQTWFPHEIEASYKSRQKI